MFLLLPSAYLRFLSEALEFSEGDFCVVPVTAFVVFNPIFAVFTLYVRLSCFCLWFCLLFLSVVVGLLGRVACDCVRGYWCFWFLGFFGGCLTVCTSSVQILFRCEKKMSSNQEATSSGLCGDAHAEKSVEKLSVKEFRERFCIPNGVFVELTNGEAVSTEKGGDHTIYFSKEQFNAGLRFPLPSLFKEFLHFTQIPPAYIHPNMVRVLIGYSILSLLFNLDFSLLEVLFIYSIKKVKSDIFNFVACLPSLQLVTSLSDSTKGAAKGHVLVKGLWVGLGTHPDRPFAPNRSLKVLGMTRLSFVFPCFVSLGQYCWVADILLLSWV